MSHRRRLAAAWGCILLGIGLRWSLAPGLDASVEVMGVWLGGALGGYGLCLMWTRGPEEGTTQ